MLRRRKPRLSPIRAEPRESPRNLEEKIVKSPVPEEKGKVQKPSTQTIRSAGDDPKVVPPAIPFRPTVRPPLAVLTLCDDGRNDGAVFRILSHRFVIGRTEGDLRIEIDGRISARHVEITLQTIAGRHHRWVLKDLRSTHGLFVRVSRMLLADRAEFLIGNGRYRFDALRYGEGASTEEFIEGRTLRLTDAWYDDTTPTQPPALTELVGHEIGNRVVLLETEYWIGSDPGCPICRSNDPFCEPRHARVYRDPKGSWQAENNKSHNGLWMRVSQLTVESTVYFQIGEQRFRLRVQ